MARRTNRTRQTFSYDEVGEVIRSATRLQQLADDRHGAGEVSLEQLRDIAGELKISPEALSRAIAASNRDMRSARRRVRRKLWWFRHAGTYAVVMAGAAGVDLAQGGGLDWFYYPALAWGTLVVIHAARAFFGRGSALEQRLLRREVSRS